MALWTVEHANFLRSEEFENPRRWALNGSGMTMRQIRDALRENDKLFAYGFHKCKDGHTLRTAAGCPQCHPRYLVKSRESITPGCIYLLRSPSTELVKVGLSKNPDDRLYMARLQGYGGIYDWKLEISLYVVRMGKAESAVKRLLSEYKIARPWIRQGEPTIAKEVYQCPWLVALDAFSKGSQDFWG